VGYQFGHNNGHNTGKSSLAPLVEKREQEILDRDQLVKEKDQEILDKEEMVTSLKAQLKAYQDADDRTPKPTDNTTRAPDLPTPDDGNKPNSGIGADGVPIQGGLSIPIQPVPNVGTGGAEEPPDGVEELFQSLQEKASGNTRVDDLVEDILKTKLSKLEDEHEAEMKIREGHSADLALLKKEEGTLTLAMSSLRKLNEKSTKDIFTIKHDALKERIGKLSVKLGQSGVTLQGLTNQIGDATKVLEVFKASRNEVETAQATSRKEHSDALTQIDSLNRKTGSLEEKIKDLSDGYSLHDILGSTTWTTEVFEEAKKHARRIPTNSKSLLDKAIVAQGKLERELEGKDGELTVAEKDLESYGKLEDFILEGVIPEGEAEKARQAVETKKKEIQKKIGELNDDKDDLTILLGENKDDRTTLEKDYSEAVKLQNEALANIILNENKLEGLFTKHEPVELEPSLTLIEAIESELSKTTNSVTSVETLINNRKTKLKGDRTKQRDLERKKGELRKITEGREPIDKKLAAYPKLDTIEKQLKVLQVAIDAIANQLDEKEKERLKLLATQAHLEESLAFLKPGPPPPPTDKIVLIPQGDNISQCAFIVKQVPPQEKKTLFGRKPSEYSEFLKFHEKQVARLQSTMQAVNYLKEESAATNLENNKKGIEELLANALIESSQILGASEAALEAKDLSGKSIVYGYSRSESGTMKIYVRELGSKPDRVPLEPGIGPDFPFLKKK